MNTFAGLLNRKICVKTTNAGYMAVEYNFLVNLMKSLVDQVELDEKWYLDQYPDVREAIDRGKYEDARGHYASHGYFENRLPYPIKVDEVWYLDTYQDIGEAVRNGLFESGQSHFQEIGFREGRLPFPNFSLRVQN